MGDGKRARDIKREMASELEKAVEFEKADLAETRQEWHDQLHNDGAQLAADMARDKEKVREALDDCRGCRGEACAGR